MALLNTMGGHGESNSVGRNSFGRRKMRVSGMFLNCLLIFARKDDYPFYATYFRVTWKLRL
jgi:hypothetical protein